MADVTINDLVNEPNPVDGDEFELQKAGGGLSRNTTKAQLLAAIQAEVDANTAKVSADGSVTTHNDVTSAGSGAIITAQERADINGSVTVHSDMTDAGSGAVITTTERSKLGGIEDGAQVNVIEALVDDPDPTLATDLFLDRNALVDSFRAKAGNTFAIGEVGFADSNSDIEKTNATAEATTKGLLVMAVEAVNAGATGRFATFGFVGGLAGLTVGAEYALATTPGGITATPSSTSGHQLRMVGRAITATIILFNPSGDWFEFS